MCNMTSLPSTVMDDEYSCDKPVLQTLGISMINNRQTVLQTLGMYVTHNRQTVLQTLGTYMTHNNDSKLNVLMRKFHRNWINNCADKLANSNTAVSEIHKVKFSHLPDYY